MKFVSTIIFSILASSLYASGIPLNSNVNIKARAGPDEVCGDPRNVLPLLRAFNPSIVDFLYTTDANEHQNAISNAGYNDEGTAGFVFSSQQPDSVPLYKTYNNAAGDHIYTTNQSERDNLVANRGYVDQGISGYVYPSPSNPTCGGVQLYRLYSSAGKAHLYTTSEDERNNATQSGVYTWEGNVGFIFPY